MARYSDVVDGLRAGMRRLVSSVSVVSLADQAGNRYAMTATSVTSLSDNPASLLVCINKSASSFPHLKAGANFCVNVLAANQQEISILCAGGSDGEDRFQKGNWIALNNVPYLIDAEANFFCENAAVHEYGTHIIVIGKLMEVLTADGVVNPLLYADGGYRTL